MTDLDTEAGRWVVNQRAGDSLRTGGTESIENRQGISAFVSSYEYAYDVNGNCIEQIETNGGDAETTAYTYDDADRLLSVEYADRTVTYSYDGVAPPRWRPIDQGFAWRPSDPTLSFVKSC